MAHATTRTTAHLSSCHGRTRSYSTRSHHSPLCSVPCSPMTSPPSHQRSSWQRLCVFYLHLVATAGPRARRGRIMLRRGRHGLMIRRVRVILEGKVKARVKENLAKAEAVETRRRVVTANGMGLEKAKVVIREVLGKVPEEMMASRGQTVLVEETAVSRGKAAAVLKVKTSREI